MAGIFGMPPGLRGYLISQQLQQQRQAQNVNALQAATSIQGAQQQQQFAAQTNPLQLQLMQERLKQMQAPPAPAEYTLGPGQARFVGGQQVAAQPFKPDVLSPAALAQQMQLKTAGRPQTNVNVPVDLGQKFQGKYAETVAADAGKRDVEQFQGVQTLTQNLEKINQVQQLLETGQPITGAGSDVLLQWERAKHFIMQDPKSKEKIRDTELLTALTGSDVFPMIKQLGIGARGLDTPAEREFLISVMTGVRSMNPETLKEMTRLRAKYTRQAIERWNKRVESGELDEFFQLQRIPKQTVPLPGGASGSVPQGVDPKLWAVMTPEERAAWQ